MEPEVHIMERYFQEICHCPTMTNVKCEGNKEIGLLAINPMADKKYPIESCVHTKSKLKKKATVKQNGISSKNGIDYISERKFNDKHVLSKIKENG